MTYRLKWRGEKLNAYGSATHTFPSAVICEATSEIGAPDVTIRMEMRDGIPEVVDFRISATSEGRAVRTADLNAWQPLEGLAINGFRQFARSRNRKAGDPQYGPTNERDFWALGGDLEAAQTAKRGPSLAELREVASVYREAINGKPVHAVQIRFGYSPRTAARRVQQARAEGLLPPTTPGKKKV